MTILSQLKKLGAKKSSQSIAKALSDIAKGNVLILYPGGDNWAYLDPECTKRYQSYAEAVLAVKKANINKLVAEDNVHIATGYYINTRSLHRTVVVFAMEPGLQTGDTPTTLRYTLYQWGVVPPPK